MPLRVAGKNRGFITIYNRAGTHLLDHWRFVAADRQAIGKFLPPGEELATDRRARPDAPLAKHIRRQRCSPLVHLGATTHSAVIIIMLREPAGDLGPNTLKGACPHEQAKMRTPDDRFPDLAPLGTNETFGGQQLLRSNNLVVAGTQ